MTRAPVRAGVQKACQPLQRRGVRREHRRTDEHQLDDSDEPSRFGPFLTTIVLFFLAQKTFIEGIATTGSKG